MTRLTFSRCLFCAAMVTAVTHLGAAGPTPSDSPVQTLADQGTAAGGFVAPSQVYELASIRINASGEDRVTGGFRPDGGFLGRNYSLRALMAAAFLRPQINPDFLIAGGPAWIDSTRFDVEARPGTPLTAGPDGPSAPRRVLLQRLLAERFGLRTHIERRPASLYRLVRVSATRYGPGLQEARECTPATPDTAAGPSSLEPPPCDMRIGPGLVVMKRAPLSQLVALLPRFLNRVVKDDTGITARIDLELRWTPAPGEWIAPPGVAADDGDWPGLATALQEQLGLRLNAERGDVDYLVIDDVHLPTEN